MKTYDLIARTGWIWLLMVELKSVDAFADVHFAQVMTYLKLGDYRLGLILNFKVAHLRDGIKRVANKL